MTKRKPRAIPIYNCYECTYHLKDDLNPYRCSKKKNKTIPEGNGEGIPRWCPLPFYTLCEICGKSGYHIHRAVF
jgi:hypothetical protein